MAKLEKGKMYFNITKERPIQFYQSLLVGGAVGSVLLLFVSFIVGIWVNMDMNVLVLLFFIASFFGFLMGISIVWGFYDYFEKILPMSLDKTFNLTTTHSPNMDEQEMSSDSYTEVKRNGLDDKGQTVDFVFPELSPDQQ